MRVRISYLQLVVSYDIEWRSLNYSISYGVILVHSVGLLLMKFEKIRIEQIMDPEETRVLICGNYAEHQFLSCQRV